MKKTAKASLRIYLVLLLALALIGLPVKASSDNVAYAKGNGGKGSSKQGNNKGKKDSAQGSKIKGQENQEKRNFKVSINYKHGKKWNTSNASSTTATTSTDGTTDETQTSDQTGQEVESEPEVQIDQNTNEVTTPTSNTTLTKIKKLHIHTTGNGKVKIQIQGELGEVEKETEDKNLVSVDGTEGGEDYEINAGEDKDELDVVEGDTTATTKFPLSIDPTTNTLVVTTPSGNVHMVVLPNAAVQNFLKKAKVKVVDSTTIQEVSGKSGITNVAYHITATDESKLVGLIPVTSEVEGDVDVESGEVTNVTQPWYLTLLGFLFTK